MEREKRIKLIRKRNCSHFASSLSRKVTAYVVEFGIGKTLEWTTEIREIQENTTLTTTEA
jgi:hypothetical protein